MQASLSDLPMDQLRAYARDCGVTGRSRAQILARLRRAHGDGLRDNLAAFGRRAGAAARRTGARLRANAHWLAPLAATALPLAGAFAAASRGRQRRLIPPRYWSQFT